VTYNNNIIMDGFIIRTEDGQDLKEQMKSQMRQHYRNDGGQGNARSVGREYEQGYRDGYREGYEQAMRDDQDPELNRHTAFSNEGGQRGGEGTRSGKYAV
jgi:flagellar biosynthesis/type III secretory pathway protein FliH